MYGVNLLFTQCKLHDVKEATKANMLKEIDSYPANQLLNTSMEDLATFFAGKFEIVPVNILDGQIYVDQQETKIDVSKDSSRLIIERDQPFYIAGTQITLYVPFEGNPDIFAYSPSTYDYNPPRGYVRGNVLELPIYRTDHDVEAAKNELNRILASVKNYLGWARNELIHFNTDLKGLAQRKIEERRQRLLKDQGLVVNLGFPLRKRADMTSTYIAPEVRRKVVPQPPPASTKAYIPEPILEMAEYENILSIIQKTATMLERSPQAFQGMDEENLRDQFLVPLNSHYEGQATGETFNFNGKTDILIRGGDRSIFIAECKIWRGQKSLSGAIDQILDYATWRDTKLAILLFNRNKELSEVLAQIPELLRTHPNFKREFKNLSQTNFRCVLSHKDDPNRELILAVLVFEVPK